MSRILWCALASLLLGDHLSAQTTQFLNINPSWSPDGRQLVFQSAREGNTALYIINADGTGLRRLTWPQFSPDDSRIVFSSTRTGEWEMFSMASDGSDTRRLTQSPGRDAPHVCTRGRTDLLSVTARVCRGQ